MTEQVPSQVPRQVPSQPAATSSSQSPSHEPSHAKLGAVPVQVRVASASHEAITPPSTEHEPEHSTSTLPGSTSTSQRAAAEAAISTEASHLGAA